MRSKRRTNKIDTMIKKTATTAAHNVKRSASKEGANVRKSLKKFASLTADMWKTFVDLIPKLIRLTIEMIKSPKVSDRAKLILIGSVCVAGFVIADQFITRFAVAPIVFILFGPLSALAALIFFDTIRMILLAITVFVIAKVFVDLTESKEVDRLSKELFGEIESREFLARIKSIYKKLNEFLAPSADKLLSAFEAIGKKKKKGFDADIAGDSVIRAASANRGKLIEWSGTVKQEVINLLREGINDV